MDYLLLSTFPAKGTRNSGDDLIAKSLMKLIYMEKGNVNIDVMKLADQDVNLVEDFDRYKAIIAPALSPTLEGGVIAPKYRPAYLEEAYKRSIPLYAFGAAGSIYPGTRKQSQNLKMDKRDKETFKNFFNNRKGVIAARDVLIEQLLVSNGIKCFGTTGDCALFDCKTIHQKPVFSQKIKKIAVSMPHNQNHWPFIYTQAKKLKEEFSCEVEMTFHGYYGTWEYIIEKDWNKGEFNLVDLSGGASKLTYYNDVDLHLGARLHAHIWFLRNRKPSFLIAEDGRGLGHLKTIDGLGESAATDYIFKEADKLIKIDGDLLKSMKEIEPEISPVSLLKKEVVSGYPSTRRSLKNVDKLWDKKMKPMLGLLP